MKFKLQAEHDDLKVCVEFEEECLTEVLCYVKAFLQGCTFKIDGELEVVYDE